MARKAERSLAAAEEALARAHALSRDAGSVIAAKDEAIAWQAQELLRAKGVVDAVEALGGMLDSPSLAEDAEAIGALVRDVEAFSKGQATTAGTESYKEKGWGGARQAGLEWRRNRLQTLG